MTAQPSRIGILISGRGSNMVALATAVSEGRIPNTSIAVVISDKPDAAGLQRARELGLPAQLIERNGRRREEHGKELITALQKNKVDLVCLAGYMRLLSPTFIEAFRHRILNIHPSLLPCFPGLDAQRQALEHGVKWSGCTVHFVDETLDGGPIIAQRCPCIDNDSVETLSERILAEEHQLYSEAVKLVLSHSFQLDGRRLIFETA